MEILCDNQAAVEAVAHSLAKAAIAGDLIALKGDLGAGKTTFTRAFVRAASGDMKADVPSPTFTLVQQYETEDGTLIYHSDLYRIQDPDEVYDLGLDEDREEAILLVEWPDRMPEDWWDGAITISLKRPDGSPMGEDEARLITVSGTPAQVARLTAEVSG